MNKRLKLSCAMYIVPFNNVSNFSNREMCSVLYPKEKNYKKRRISLSVSQEGMLIFIRIFIVRFKYFSFLIVVVLRDFLILQTTVTYLSMYPRLTLYSRQSSCYLRNGIGAPSYQSHFVALCFMYICIYLFLNIVYIKYCVCIPHWL